MVYIYILVTIYDDWITMVNVQLISDVVFRKELAKELRMTIDIFPTKRCGEPRSNELFIEPRCFGNRVQTQLPKTVLVCPNLI